MVPGDQARRRRLTDTQSTLPFAHGTRAREDRNQPLSCTQTPGERVYRARARRGGRADAWLHTRGLIEFDTIAPMTIDRVRVERVARQVAQEGRGGVKRKR